MVRRVRGLFSMRSHRRYVPFRVAYREENPLSLLTEDSWHDVVYDRTARWETSAPTALGIGLKSIKTPAIIVIIFARFSRLGATAAAVDYSGEEIPDVYLY